MRSCVKNAASCRSSTSRGRASSLTGGAYPAARLISATVERPKDSARPGPEATCQPHWRPGPGALGPGPEPAHPYRRADLGPGRLHAPKKGVGGRPSHRRHDHAALIAIPDLLVPSDHQGAALRLGRAVGAGAGVGGAHSGRSAGAPTGTVGAAAGAGGPRRAGLCASEGAGGARFGTDLVSATNKKSPGRKRSNE